MFYDDCVFKVLFWKHCKKIFHMKINKANCLVELIKKSEKEAILRLTYELSKWATVTAAITHTHTYKIGAVLQPKRHSLSMLISIVALCRTCMYISQALIIFAHIDTRMRQATGWVNPIFHRGFQLCIRRRIVWCFNKNLNFRPINWKCKRKVKSKNNNNKNTLEEKKHTHTKFCGKSFE